jgi:hypothetical protein
MDSNCRHCGNEGSTKQVGNVEIERFSQDDPQHGSFDFTKFVQVDKCGVCNGLTIWQAIWGDDFGEVISDRLLYPSSRDNSSLPEKVRKRLEAADRVRRLDPGLYAVAIRRMLETVFNDQGAEGRDLFHKAEDLVKKGQLPPNIAVAVSHLRDIGKYGAHDEEIEVAKDDVPLIENLADAVLEFVYRSPAAITALEKSIVDRGGQLSSSTMAPIIPDDAETAASGDS